MSATHITSGDSIRGLNTEDRNCLFEDENSKLLIYRNYTQSNCLFECFFFGAQKFVQKKYTTANPCVPWFFPTQDEYPHICNPWQAFDFLAQMSNVPTKNCQHCLPDCSSTIYQTKFTAVPLRTCELANMGSSRMCKSMTNPLMLEKTIQSNYENRLKSTPYFSKKYSSTRSTRKISSALPQGDIFGSTDTSYDAFQTDIAKIQIFFKSATATIIHREQAMTWVDFLANLGGIFGLVLGLGIIFVFEIVWLAFCIYSQTCVNCHL